MEILCKNNIGICFSSGFSSVGSTINHSHDMISMTIITCVLFIIPKLARHERLHKIMLIASLLFQLYCGSVRGVSIIIMKVKYACSMGMLSKLMILTTMENMRMYSMAGSFFLRHAIIASIRPNLLKNRGTLDFMFTSLYDKI